ncbi:hypothetical protein BJY04DRAFT_149751 [Aspergillus karnatakaensis]|uniref:uncharacterized protein n=1 Tax=Aspergillus karnatakaensis TaxID=1810916 RepID=UPI003CCDD718
MPLGTNDKPSALSSEVHRPFRRMIFDKILGGLTNRTTKVCSLDFFSFIFYSCFYFIFLLSFYFLLIILFSRDCSITKKYRCCTSVPGIVCLYPRINPAEKLRAGRQPLTSTPGNSHRHGESRRESSSRIYLKIATTKVPLVRIVTSN